MWALLFAVFLILFSYVATFVQFRILNSPASSPKKSATKPTKKMAARVQQSKVKSALCKKLTVSQRLKLSKEQYRTYMKQAKSLGVEKISPIKSLKAPVIPKRDAWKRQPVPKGYVRLGLSCEEYRQKVFNRRTPKNFPAPKQSKKAQGTKPLKGFRRLSMGPKEYREAVKNIAPTAQSLLPVEKENKKVSIPGRKPLKMESQKNFRRLSLTREERKAGGFKPQDNKKSRFVKKYDVQKTVNVKKPKTNWKKKEVKKFDRLSMTKEEYREWRKQKPSMVKIVPTESMS